MRGKGGGRESREVHVHVHVQYTCRMVRDKAKEEVDEREEVMKR